jgi:hypothetical protein
MNVCLPFYVLFSEMRWSCDGAVFYIKNLKSLYELVLETFIILRRERSYRAIMSEGKRKVFTVTFYSGYRSS